MPIHKTNEICIFLQARMSSVRLPGKSLMNISGYPLVVLSALRAGNTGRKVVVLTSTDKSDDILFDIISSYGIECLRGDLKNVLGRFKEATDRLGLYKDSLIVRLTGDNIVPDGKLIDNLIKAYQELEKIDYIGADYLNDKLPYGINVELFLLSALDNAYYSARSMYDLEHVTPWIKKNYKCNGMSPYIDDIEYTSQKLNLTIDSIEELEYMRSIFQKIDRPLHIPWHEVCKIASESNSKNNMEKGDKVLKKT
jgi:spore coat polysaccharide biosynthesis protein SpsF (cytidylyltransferase family)